MIGKTLQNDSFRETTRYVLGKEKARLLGGTVANTNPDAIAREFRMSQDLNPTIKRPVYHLVDAYSYSDAATKNLTDEFLFDRAIERFAGLVVSAREPELLRKEDKTEYKQKVEDFIESELYEYQWFCAAHEDTQHRHTHLVASRINLIDGRCIPTWQDKERTHRICREIEKEHGLQPLKSYYEIERRSLTRNQKAEWEKTGIPPVMVLMQDAIDEEATPGRSLEAVQKALWQKHGIALHLINHSKEKPGILFEKTDKEGKTVRMAGYQLGRGYTLPALKQRLAQQQQEMNLDVPGDESGDKSQGKSEDKSTIDKSDRRENSLLEQLLQEQKAYIERIIPHMKAIWERENAGQPKTRAVIFGDYQIQPSQEGELELYRRGRAILFYQNGKHQSRGLSEKICSAIEQFDQQQAQDMERQSVGQRDHHVGTKSKRIEGKQGQLNTLSEDEKLVLARMLTHCGVTLTEMNEVDYEDDPFWLARNSNTQEVSIGWLGEDQRPFAKGQKINNEWKPTYLSSREDFDQLQRLIEIWRQEDMERQRIQNTQSQKKESQKNGGFELD